MDISVHKQTATERNRQKPAETQNTHKHTETNINEQKPETGLLVILLAVSRLKTCLCRNCRGK